MDKLRELNTNYKNYYEQIKKIDSIKDIKERMMLFYNFYGSYWEYMSYLNKQISNRIHNPNEVKVKHVKQFKGIQKLYTEKKIEIDKILNELPDREIIIPFIMQKNKNQFSKSKNLANRIQIKVENQNSKYVTNLSKEDIDNLSNSLDNYYNLILENPAQEYFIIFYEIYTKLMKELNRIKIPASKSNIDKIKKGLIAKKENIDKLFFKDGSLNTTKEKTNANRITPKNIELNNLNRIILKHPRQNIEISQHKAQILKRNNIISQKPHHKNISRLNELQLKKDIIGLNKKEEVELKQILLQKNKKFQNNLNKFAARFPNLGINGKGKNTGAGIMSMNPNALQFA
jgi:hypothetical protein